MMWLESDTSLPGRLLRGIEETMVRLGVRQLVMPCFRGEAEDGSTSQHSWALSRGYDLPGRQESMTAMRYNMLRFSGLPTLCKKVSCL
jgi:hypothetical protein